MFSKKILKTYFPWNELNNLRGFEKGHIYKLSYAIFKDFRNFTYLAWKYDAQNTTARIKRNQHANKCLNICNYSSKLTRNINIYFCTCKINIDHIHYPTNYVTSTIFQKEFRHFVFSFEFQLVFLINLKRF